MSNVEKKFGKKAQYLLPGCLIMDGIHFYLVELMQKQKISKFVTVLEQCKGIAKISKRKFDQQVSEVKKHLTYQVLF